MHRFSFLVLLLALSIPSSAETIRVAVAANFHSALKDVADLFESQTGHRVLITPGSSGQLASQVLQGAPFDLFLSADSERVAFLVDRDIGLADTNITYAIGKLVVVSGRGKPLDKFKTGQFERIAIANPQLAPYGQAAMEVFEFFNLDISDKDRVTANNVAQAFNYWHTGNVDMALVGLAQVIDAGLPDELFSELPQEAYAEIQQQMLLLSNLDAAHDFFSFLQSAQATPIVTNRGYSVP